MVSSILQSMFSEWAGGVMPALVLALLMASAGAVLAWILKVAAKPQPSDQPTPDEAVLAPKRLRVALWRDGFRQALRRLARSGVRDARYRAPWVALLDDRPAGASALAVEQAGVALLPGVVDEPVAGAVGAGGAVADETGTSGPPASGVSWQFFRGGVVLGIDIDALRDADRPDDLNAWDELLRLCRRYRPRRPLESVVVTVPATLLLDDAAPARLALLHRARQMHLRLRLAQQRFALRLPVYVVLTGCEALPGFVEFADALPGSLREDMLGWSVPYELSATYRPGWTGEAVASIVRTVSETSAELFAGDLEPAGARRVLALPGRVQALRGGLQCYLDELLQASAHHDPVLFRGLYLTGDAEPSRGLQPETVAAESSAPGAALEPFGEAGGGEAPASTGPIGPMGQPVFLRALFERRIFLERGLARRTERLRLAQPLSDRGLRWVGVLALAAWAVGLGVAVVELRQQRRPMLAALAAMRGDAADRAQAQRLMRELPPSWYRARAQAYLERGRHVRVSQPWTVLMPGSWAVFDDLQPQLRERFTREFGEIALTAIARQLTEQAGRLTGVGVDATTGRLLDAQACEPPGGAAAGEITSLDGAAQAVALQRFVADAQRQEDAWRTLRRLAQPVPGGPADDAGQQARDFRQLVTFALGPVPEDELKQALPHLRRYARGHAADAAPATALGAGDATREAWRCAFQRLDERLVSRLFVDNPLLASERAVRAALEGLTRDTRLPAAEPVVGELGRVMPRADEPLRRVVTALDAQQTLAARAGGGWMRRDDFLPSSALERALAQADRLALLGAEVVAVARERHQVAFKAFIGQRAALLDQDAGGLIWQDKEKAYTQAPSRRRLREGLAALVAHPLLAASRELDTPSLGAVQGLSWSGAQLEQALALGEARKRVVAESLKDVPPALLVFIVARLDAHVAQLVFDATMDAATVVPVSDETAAAAHGVARPALLKVRALLTELRAARHVERLDALLSNEALARLRGLDESLERSGLYPVRAIEGAPGAPGVPAEDGAAPRDALLSLFGLTTAAQLPPYVADQAARAALLGARADSYLAALDGASGGSALASRWRAFAQDMERYRLRNPNSALLRLEQLVLSLPDGVEGKPGGCPAVMAAVAPAHLGTPLSEWHARLLAQLQERCAAQEQRRRRQQWEQLATDFNATVAGRRPFAPVPLEGPGGSAAAVPVADPAAVAGLLKRLPVAVPGPTAERRGDVTPVQRFLTAFERSRAWLTPLFPVEEGQVGGYDVAVEFRAARDDEVAANQVIDWRLSLGEQSLGPGAPGAESPKLLRWTPGMPVTLQLRLAKDAPLAPAVDPQQRALRVEERSLTWRFDDPWALLTLLQHQHAPEATPGGGQLLRFEFPLAAVDLARATSGAASSRGRVFLRLRVMPAGKPAALVGPPTFPVRAPAWSSS